MGLRKILTTKEPALHKTCKAVEKFDSKLHKLLDDMRDTLLDSGGVGLAAPQGGILRRVVLVDTGDDFNAGRLPLCRCNTSSRSECYRRTFSKRKNS